MIQLLVSNLGMAATFTHLLLWNRRDLKAAWSWIKLSELKKLGIYARQFDWRIWRDDGVRGRNSGHGTEEEELDPHYREMLKYADAPNSWYGAILLISCIVGLVVIYKAESTLPW